MKYTFNTGLHLDSYEPISFKLYMVIHRPKLYTLVPVWMTDFYLKVKHGIVRKLDFLQSFCYKSSNK